MPLKGGYCKNGQHQGHIQYIMKNIVLVVLISIYTDIIKFSLYLCNENTVMKSVDIYPGSKYTLMHGINYFNAFSIM